MDFNKSISKHLKRRFGNDHHLRVVLQARQLWSRAPLAQLLAQLEAFDFDLAALQETILVDQVISGIHCCDLK